MNAKEIIEKVQSKEDFVSFVNGLVKDNLSSELEWQNKTISDYLTSIASWIEDSDGYFANTNTPKPDLSEFNWGFLSLLLYVGKIYE